jgi:alkylation response protein AidB-like acyl-CoA dehydrogenase
MFDLELTDEQALVQETVSSFARNEIRPIARDADESGEIPREVVDKGFELGLIHSALPEEHGGFGEERSAVTGAIVAEELGWGDLSIALHMLAPRLFAYPLMDLGTASQKRELLPAFARGFSPATAAVVEPRIAFDPANLATRAERRGGDFVLSGRKCFVPLAREAERMLVFAQLDDAPSAFVVERGAAGLGIEEREKNMGIKALATAEVSLEDVRVPAAARLEGDLRATLDRTRVGIAALAVGVARGAYEFARDYAKERKAFGVPIAQKQAIAFILADMAIEIDAARLLVWEAAWLLDQGRDATREAVLAKRYAAAAALKITDNAVQVLGGHGYIRDYPVELWLRNARGFSSFEGLAIV